FNPPDHYSYSNFQAHEKMVHSRRCAFPVSRAQAKKTRQGLNSPSNFRAHEKTVHTVIALFAFLERKKKSPHRAIFLIFVYEW
ncbi:TPA: hypothetical protein ACGO6N_000655, partial [Streptococcus suis]